MKKNVYHTTIFLVYPRPGHEKILPLRVISLFLGQFFRFIQFNDHFIRKNSFRTQLNYSFTGENSFRTQLQSIFIGIWCYINRLNYNFIEEIFFNTRINFIFIREKFHHIRFESIFTQKKFFRMHLLLFLHIVACCTVPESYRIPIFSQILTFKF